MLLTGRDEFRLRGTVELAPVDALVLAGSRRPVDHAVHAFEGQADDLDCQMEKNITVFEILSL